MPMNWLRENVTKARANLAAEVSKFQNKAFMEAVVSGCALVAAADGSIDASEKQKMAQFLERSDELKHFDIRQVIEVSTKQRGFRIRSGYRQGERAEDDRQDSRQGRPSTLVGAGDLRHWCRRRRF